MNFFVLFETFRIDDLNSKLQSYCTTHHITLSQLHHTTSQVTSHDTNHLRAQASQRILAAVDDIHLVGSEGVKKIGCDVLEGIARVFCDAQVCDGDFWYLYFI